MRLTGTGYELGVVPSDRWNAFNEKRDAIEQCKKQLRETNVHPGEKTALAFEELSGEQIRRDTKLHELLKRPQVEVEHFQASGWLCEIPCEVLEQASIDIKYEGYIARQEKEIESALSKERQAIPETLNYQSIDGLSNELRQKLGETRPRTMANASRIPGITPAALSLIAVHSKRERDQRKIA